MLISRLKLKNWRNFPSLDLSLGRRAYIIGANASGKSNLLDVFRFLRTIAWSEGGGLQRAVKDRGGLTKLRSLHARRDPEVRVEFELTDKPEAACPTWSYSLAFKSAGKGGQHVLITQERVHHNGALLLDRPNADDRKDDARLTQTHLEQINNNQAFRALADHFAGTLYLHLVPQLLKHGEALSSRLLDSDPFGQGLMGQVAATKAATRNARLKRIQTALQLAVPQFSKLEFEQDPNTGRPHLRVNFKHWRENGSWQREDQFSDGTLRLLGLLWALQAGDGLLLLEEPELSLNDAITELVPLMIDRVLRARKSGRQVLISTHSDKLMASIGDPATIVLLEAGAEGTSARTPEPEERLAMQNGLTPAEVMLPRTRPGDLRQLGLF